MGLDSINDSGTKKLIEKVLLYIRFIFLVKPQRVIILAPME